MAEPARQAFVLAGVSGSLGVHPGRQGVPVGLCLLDCAMPPVGMRDMLVRDQVDPGVQRRLPGPQAIGPPVQPAQPPERQMADAIGLSPGDAAHGGLAVGGTRGVAGSADTVLLGNQGPDGAAGHPRPSPDADPDPGQPQEAARTQTANPVGLGQIMVTANRPGESGPRSRPASGDVGSGPADLTMVRSDAPSGGGCCPAGNSDPMVVLHPPRVTRQRWRGKA